MERARRLGHRWEGPGPEPEGFFALVDPTVEAGAAFFNHGEHPWYPDLGWTSLIRDHNSPDIDYGAEARDIGGSEQSTEPQWHAKPQVTEDSDEGTNDSWALGEGTHDVEDDEVDAVRISAARATDIEDAEKEHVQDYRYARDHILAPGEAWLRNELNGTYYGPAASEGEVEELVDSAINEGLQEHLGLAGVASEEFHWANLHAYYARAGSQTSKRDDHQWHAFDYEPIEEQERTINVVNQSATTAINQHTSEDVIDLEEVT